LLARATSIVDVVDQPLRAERAPVGVAHVLQHVLHDLAPALLGHQVLVGLLLRAVIRDAEVQQVPRQRQAGQAAVVLGRGGRAQADGAVRLAGGDVDAFGDAAGRVAAAEIAGVGDEPRQHVEFRHVVQAARQCALHQLEPVVEVVLERPRRRLVEGDRPGYRFLLGEHLLAVAGDAIPDLVLRVGRRCQRAASAEQK
jgi:hypothetical protein